LAPLLAPGPQPGNVDIEEVKQDVDTRAVLKAIEHQDSARGG
jgi:hypothetical protein